MPPMPASPMPTKLTRRATISALMPLMPASVGLSATARMALPVRVKARKRNSAAMATTAMTRFSTCCGPMRSAARLPVAPERESVAAQVVAEDEADDVLQRDGERDRADGGSERARGRGRLQHHLVVDHARHARHQERDDHRGPGRQAAGGIGDIAGEGADGGVRGHVKLGKRSTA